MMPPSVEASTSSRMRAATRPSASMTHVVGMAWDGSESTKRSSRLPPSSEKLG